MRSQLQREVAMLKAFDDKEKKSHGEALKKTNAASSETLLTTLKSISDAVDAEPSRRFSIYAKDAQARVIA